MPGAAQHFVNARMNELVFEHGELCFRIGLTREKFAKAGHSLSRRGLAVRVRNHFRGNVSVVADVEQSRGNRRHVGVSPAHGSPVRISEFTCSWVMPNR